MNSKERELPAIPDKVYFTIGEVAQLCAVKAHVIRYWETEFKPLKPVRRRNRRYYRRKDVELVRQICVLLYQEGYTIEGARQRLLEPTEPVQAANTAEAAAWDKATVVAELKAILADLQS